MSRGEVDWLLRELQRQADDHQRLEADVGKEREWQREQVTKLMHRASAQAMALAVGIMLVLLQRACPPSVIDHESVSPSRTPTSDERSNERSESMTSPFFRLPGP